MKAKYQYWQVLELKVFVLYSVCKKSASGASLVVIYILCCCHIHITTTLPNPYSHFVKELLQRLLQGAPRTQRCAQRRGTHRPRTNERGDLPSAFSPSSPARPLPFHFPCSFHGAQLHLLSSLAPVTVWAVLCNTKLLPYQQGLRLTSSFKDTQSAENCCLL